MFSFYSENAWRHMLLKQTVCRRQVPAFFFSFFFLSMQVFKAQRLWKALSRIYELVPILRAGASSWIKV